MHFRCARAGPMFSFCFISRACLSTAFASELPGAGAKQSFESLCRDAIRGNTETHCRTIPLRIARRESRTPCKNSGRRPSPRVKHFGCLSPKGEFPKCTEDDRACRKEFLPGALLWVAFLGHARKATKKRIMNFGETFRVQDPYFFSAAHRLAVLHAGEQVGFITLFSGPDALSLRTCKPAVIFLFHYRGHA